MDGLPTRLDGSGAEESGDRGWAECLAGALELERRARAAAGSAGQQLARAAAGLRVAAAILAPPRKGKIRPLRFGTAGLSGGLAAGHLCLARRRHGQAALIAAGIMAVAPEHAAAHRFLGQVEFAQGNYAGAVAAYRAAIAANPADALVRAFHAEALWFSGEHDVARVAVWHLRMLDGPGAKLAAALDEAFRDGSISAVKPGRAIGQGGMPWEDLCDLGG
jgi:tetratricopeptide (TPR) repeat protein